MWPHKMLVDVGAARPLRIASDRLELLDRFTRWQIDDPISDDEAIVDVGIRTDHPKPKPDAGAYLPTLFHGSCKLNSSTSIDAVTWSALQFLGQRRRQHQRPTTLLRLAVVSDGSRAVLVPQDTAYSLSERALARENLMIVSSVANVVGRGSTIEVEPTLGSTDVPAALTAISAWTAPRGERPNLDDKWLQMSEAMELAEVSGGASPTDLVANVTTFLSHTPLVECPDKAEIVRRLRDLFATTG